MNENPESRVRKRRRFSGEQRRELLAAFQQRQEAAKDFARKHRVAASTLHRWVKAGGDDGLRRPTKPLELREVHVERPMVGFWAGEISLPNGTTMRWNGTAGLAGIEQLLPQLRQPC